MTSPAKRITAWQRIDTCGVEYAEIQLRPVVLEGEVAVIEGGVPFAVSYRVECDSAGMHVKTHVRCKRPEGHTTLLLERSAEGRWTRNGAPQPRLEGLADVDLSITPSTNTPSIRRLQLGVGQRAEVTAVWVTFPSLDIAPLRQFYRRVTEERYAYEAPDLGFATEIECDEDSIVRTYAGLWIRCS